MTTTKVPASSVSVSTEQYEFCHGGLPKGRGNWMFFYSVGAAMRTFRWSGLYSEAKREAVKSAGSQGSYSVKVGA